MIMRKSVRFLAQDQDLIQSEQRNVRAEADQWTERNFMIKTKITTIAITKINSMIIIIEITINVIMTLNIIITTQIVVIIKATGIMMTERRKVIETMKRIAERIEEEVEAKAVEVQANLDQEVLIIKREEDLMTGINILQAKKKVDKIIRSQKLRLLI